jgi:predicted amidophosphoribosyltransferase
MKLLHDTTTCSLCKSSLDWWHAQACSHCGRAICSHHAHMVRRPYSKVLYVMCADCSQNSAHPTISAAPSHPQMVSADLHR